jgi:hypothetical protein
VIFFVEAGHFAMSLSHALVQLHQKTVVDAKHGITLDMPLNNRPFPIFIFPIIAYLFPFLQNEIICYAKNSSLNRDEFHL